MGKLILLRHGQSAWNKENVFTGWIDIPLSKEGIAQSIEAGKKIKDISIDVIYTSMLVRAQTTIFLAMTETSYKKVPFIYHPKQEPFSDWYHKGIEGKELIPVHMAVELNERMYGELQGKNKDQMRQEYGQEQIHVWRRSFDEEPPQGESLAKTAKRAIPFFVQTIIPELEAGKNVVICAHGNSLRSIVMHIEKLSQEQVLHLEIATGEVKIYEYQQGTFFPT